MSISFATMYYFFKALMKPDFWESHAGFIRHLFQSFRGDIFSRGFVSPRPLRHGYLGGTTGAGYLGGLIHHDENQLLVWVKSLVQKPRTLRYSPKIAGIDIIYGC